MNINPIIEKIFKNFTVDGKQIPISYMRYSGKGTAYLTYYTWHEKPNLFSDDDYHAEEISGTIDIFSKGNFKNILEAVKKKLKENNLIWTDNGAETFEEDSGFFHVPINFSFAQNTKIIEKE